MDRNGYEDGEERRHTPSLRATPLKRGSVGSRGGLGLVERKGYEWTAAAGEPPRGGGRVGLGWKGRGLA
jgi:hypothetical protein